MTRFPVLSICALSLLAACAAPDTQPTIGADGRPLPRVYHIDKRTEAEIPGRLLEAVNTLRSAKGVQPLQYNGALIAAANAHSRDMSEQNRPWHFGSDGSSPLLRVQRAGYAGHLQGELISETYETELDTLASWTAVPDTRAVVMDPQSNEIGFSWYQEPSGKIWWTLLTGDSTRAPVARVSATALGRTVTSEMDHVGGAPPAQ
ncbi:Cysteine-rich secretory protein family protein [Gemmobacter caeni]|jgi:uncharacterized protein YkwD|uniref:SCP domain-containing protein n=2 Tax=Gemmobacter TaxID=204456 RepID=A0A2T6AQV0_9RHOB|nr:MULTISPECIES: CAP domain-containing protein [Gemmobacter]OJY33053.1 MAG: serine protease [Rhodobacterales bacterium 65-51]PTX46205.1 hypothetical protein C8N34_11878 [Gemmobacter caeni]TWI94430.1 Cysteine-rich secretory protein family protein [Gemmobacter caeni]GHC29805.1 hypothetical protein GCM10007291_33030 [Gemmobacter nanjingensis]